MKNQRPDADRENEAKRAGKSTFLAIKELHYHGNDLTELRKLAEVSPELAAKVIDQRDREDERINSSYRFAVASTVVLVALAIASLSYLLVTTGVFATLCAIAGILAIALLVRVILTGEWSDTSWFGKLVHLLVRSLGGKPGAGDGSR